MIPEPQKTYVLELLAVLGSAADDFVIVGAQAMKFLMEGARATKDIDFVLDAVALRGAAVPLRERLTELGYSVVEGARNFQFQKPIPTGNEMMRIEFLAPEELKRPNDIRVDVQEGIHARACTGGGIAIAESDAHKLSGRLPNGEAFTGSARVTRAHALLMLKLLALDDRHANIRGPGEMRHDREEARIHAADIVAIVSVQADLALFKENFERQFGGEPALGLRVIKVLNKFFRESTSPGLLVYEEHLAANRPADQDSRRELHQEIERAHKMMLKILG